MGLITKEVDISPCGQTKYYEELGYSIPRVLQKCKDTKYYLVTQATKKNIQIKIYEPLTR